MNTSRAKHVSFFFTTLVTIVFFSAMSGCPSVDPNTGSGSARCGDGTVDPGEQCDPPNGTTCNDNCRLTGSGECGNGIVEAGEQCELPNGITCDNTCALIIPAGCGNDIIDDGEECEPPNTTHCDVGCRLIGSPVCGNRTVETGEECEPPNTTNCDANCQLVEPAECGNGVVEEDEQCEPPGTLACDEFCQITSTQSTEVMTKLNDDFAEEWSDFSPPLDNQEAAPEKDENGNDIPSDLSEQILDVEMITDEVDDKGTPDDKTDDEAIVELFEDVTYVCTETKYNITQNPSKMVMYAADDQVMWPGALLQGGPLRSGQLKALPITQRTPINVVISALNTDNNYQTVVNPSFATVTQARGEMINQALGENLPTPSSIQFEIRTLSSQEEFALKAGISGKHFGFSASAGFSKNSKSSMNTVAANFIQKMFTVTVEPPEFPSAFFSGDFTPEKLQQQIDLNNIGPDNIPVYMASVVYGRMMMFTMRSSASKKEMTATIKAAYNGIGSSVALSLSAKQKKILQTSEIKFVAIGGDSENALAAIRSGNWNDYFTKTALISTAAPLSYVIKNLTDNEVATVSETASYTLKECTASPRGLFKFIPEVTDKAPIDVPFNTLMGDFDGDGKEDILRNHLISGSNQIYVSLSKGDGSFTNTILMDYEVNEVVIKPASGWLSFDTVIGDLNGDGRDDIIWNRTRDDENIIYVGISNGDGTFDFLPRQEHPVTSLAGCDDDVELAWGGFDTVVVGDLNGDGNDDLIWNLRSSCNIIYYATSLADENTHAFTGFYYLQDGETVPQESHIFIGGDWHDYTLLLGDIDGNGTDDLLWNALSRLGTEGSQNEVHIATTSPDPVVPGKVTINVPANSLVLDDQPTGTDSNCHECDCYNIIRSKTFNWAEFEAFVDDVDGDSRDDLIFVRRSTGGWHVGWAYVGYFEDGLKLRGLPDNDPVNTDNHFQKDLWRTSFTMKEGEYHLRVGDINGDGRADIVGNFADPAENETWVLLGNPDNTQLDDFTPFDTTYTDCLKSLGTTCPCNTGTDAEKEECNSAHVECASRVQQHPATEVFSWSPYGKFFLGDVNGDDKDDMIFANTEKNTSVYSVIAKSRPD